MNQILITIILLIILILFFKNTEKFSNCNSAVWNDDSCDKTQQGGECVKPVDSDDTSEWNCQSDNKHVVILFYTDWCLYSKNFMPIWEQISTLNKDDDNIVFIKINCDPDNSKCANKISPDSSSTNCSNGKEIYNDYNISQVPMVLFIPREDTEYAKGIRFNLSINGIDSENDENEQSFDRFIKLNISNFP
jgi:thiol-disulfide isomerase/thioredoxin